MTAISTSGWGLSWQPYCRPLESIGGIIRMKSLESIAIRAQDTLVMVVGAGENFLVAAIINNRTDPVNIQSQILAVAKTIGESM